MALDLGTLVAKVRVDDGDFDQKTSGWSAKGAGIASAFGNVAADAISQAASALGDFVGDAMEASDATDKFKTSLQFAGLDNGTIERLTASTKAYADETVYSLTDIMGITSNLAGAGVKDYDKLAEALGNFNSVAGGSQETYGRLGSVLTQTAGAGKLTTENWNQITDAVGGSSAKLQEALLQAGAYTGDFRTAMEKGEITAEEFNAALMTLGTDPVAVEAARSTETFEGAAGNLAATLTGVLTEALDLIKGPLTSFQSGLAWFIGNSGLFIPIIAGIGVALLTVFAPAIWAAVAATAAWTVALLANPMTWIVLGIVALVAAIVWLIQNWDVAVAWISEVWGGFMDWIVSVIDGFVAWWNGIWEAVGAWITGVWNGFIGWITDQFNLFMLGLRVIGDGIATWWNGLWSGIGNWIKSVWDGFISWVTDLAVGWVSFLMSAFDAYVSFWVGLWEGVQDTVVNVWEGIVSFFEGIPDTILGFFRGAGEWLYNVGSDIIQGLIDGINSMIGAVGDAVGGVLDWAAGFFPHSPAKRGPLSGSGWYAIGEAGEAVVAAFAAGLADDTAVNAELEAMLNVPTTGGLRSGWGSDGPVTSVTKNVTYVAAENQSLSSEEALFAALGSPRVRD